MIKHNELRDQKIRLFTVHKIKMQMGTFVIKITHLPNEIMCCCEYNAGHGR